MGLLAKIFGSSPPPIHDVARSVRWVIRNDRSIAHAVQCLEALSPAIPGTDYKGSLFYWEDDLIRRLGTASAESISTQLTKSLDMFQRVQTHSPRDDAWMGVVSHLTIEIAVLDYFATRRHGKVSVLCNRTAQTTQHPPPIPPAHDEEGVIAWFLSHDEKTINLLATVRTRLPDAPRQIASTIIQRLRQHASPDSLREYVQLVLKSTAELESRYLEPPPPGSEHLAQLAIEENERAAALVAMSMIQARILGYFLSRLHGINL